MEAQAPNHFSVSTVASHSHGLALANLSDLLLFPPSPASVAAMVDEPLDPPPPTPAAAAPPTPLLRPRREAFEHGLLPIPKLIFPEGTLAQTLSQLKEKLAPAAAAAGDGRVGAASLAEALQIPPDQAALAIGMLAAVLPAEDPALDAGGSGGGADLRDVLLFLYIQSYKRLVPRPHKDSPVVADVWPSTSAFDGYLSALSPIQLVRSNSRRFIPSQADEEIHQLSYLQKHMANILTLLADSVEGEGDDSLVLTMETFEHLGFLVHFSEGTSLSQAATFFANSDPDMPAAPVSAAQVHDWILQNIVSSLEFYTEKSTAKEGSQQIASDLDVTMADANTSHPRNSTTTVANPAFHRNSTFVEGFSKTSVVKHASDVKGNSVKVLNCHDSVIYILAPVKYATVYGCSDTTVVLGAVGKVIKVEHCERVHIIAAAKRICIANCRECIFYLGVNHQPLIVGDNHKLHIAPFNTYYPRLGEHLTQVGVDPSTNKWDQPFVLGVVDPHDSLSHPAGVSDVQAESATCVDPDLFTNFLIPNWFEDEVQEPTKCNPFPLPEIYQASQSKKQAVLEDTKKTIRELQLDENRKKELASALHSQFKDWLYATGNIRQLYCLQGD
ncbi:TBCC domain-containing protein 1-like isoform X1 [Triticum urartu]|nr:TBCC domain-containing protein 1-like isoform X1 [Triticum urartu]